MKLLRTCFVLLILANTAFAACDPVDDPCVPKKELDAWTKSLAFGLNMTTGNSETKLFTGMANLAKETKDDLWNFDLQYGYGENGKDQNGVDLDEKVNRNDGRFNTSYKYLYSDRAYVGLDNKFLYDDIAEVDYRNNITPLVGYYLLKDQDFSFNLETGPGYLFERVGGETDNYLAPRIGQGFSWTISCTSKIYQTTDFTFDVNDSSNYLALTSAGIEAALNSSMSLLFFARHTYDNVPAAGREKGDLAIISALKFNL